MTNRKPRNPNPGLLRPPTAEELDSIGAKPSAPSLDPSADPNCPSCRGTGFVDDASKLRGGNCCPCTFAGGGA